MAPSTRSTKRKEADISSREDDICTLRKRKRLSRKKIAFRILDLPSEVRHLILEELLWRAQPLESIQHAAWFQAETIRHPYVRNGIEPAILQTCKQLYNEGIEILYDNTISARCDTFNDGIPSATIYPFILWQDWDRMLGTLPTAVRQLASKLSIHIHMVSSDADTSIELQEQLRTIARALRRTPAWQDITVQVTREDEGASDINKWTQAEAKVLQPLQYLRNLRRVEFKGTVFPAKKSLAMDMMSSEPVADLELMHDRLWTYVHSMLDEEVNSVDDINAEAQAHAWDLLRNTLRSTRDNKDVKKFKRDRDRLMRLVTFITIRKQSTVMFDDPEGWTISHLLGPREDSEWVPMMPLPSFSDTSALAEFERRTFYASGHSGIKVEDDPLARWVIELD